MKTALKFLGVVALGLSWINPNLSAAETFHGSGRGSGEFHGGGGFRSGGGFHSGGSFRGVGGGFHGRRGFYGHGNYGARWCAPGVTFGYYGGPSCYSYPVYYYPSDYSYNYEPADDLTPAAAEAPPVIPSVVVPMPGSTAVQAPSAPAQTPNTSLAEIKAMTKAQIDDSLIISLIRNTHSVYHLRAANIIDLKDAGVSQHVIEYMVNTPTS